MKARIRMALVAVVWAARLPGQSEVVAAWPFDEPTGDVARDSASGSSDPISGFHKAVAGVVKSALQFDGYTTRIVRPAAAVPVLTREFTIDAWIALDAYPWNQVAVVDHAIEGEAGYLFSIDAWGHPGLHAAAGGSWRTLTSEASIPLKKWTHIAGTFHRDRGLALYLDGKLVGELAAHGDLTPATQTDLLIGAVRKPMLPAPSASIHPRDPVWYSLEGSLDELRIHSRCLSATEIAKSYAAIQAPRGPTSAWSKLPAGPDGPGRFGAYYTTLKFEDTWERPRRTAPDSDVIVRFPQSPMRLVFWQGTNYVPAWVTENGKWYTDEFMEAYGQPQCPDGEDCEPMSDKQNRYSHVRILESTEARAVVHWRYALTETRNYKGSWTDPVTGWFDWADEYWTVYPDGIAVRKQVLWSSNLDPTKHEFQETIVLNGPGERPEDNIHLDALVLANLKGETRTYSWREKTDNTFDFPHGPASFPDPEKANIQWINLKSAWKPFQIVPGEPVHITAYNGEKTFSAFEWWNHWPVAQIPSSGRPALAPDRPSHTSLSHIYWPPYEQTAQSISKLLMDGLTTASPAELAPLAKSWLTPAAVEASGLQSHGYDAAQRAWVFTSASAGVAAVTLLGSPATPIVNPALLIRNWGSAVRVRINGKRVSPGEEVRIGKVERLEGSDLVIWIQMQSTQPVRIDLEPEP